MNRKEQYDISRKLKVLNYVKEIENISKTCRYFGICRKIFYTWKRAYEAHQVPGHHVQVDVKFLFFKDKKGTRIKRF